MSWGKAGREATTDDVGAFGSGGALSPSSGSDREVTHLELLEKGECLGQGGLAPHVTTIQRV